MAFFQKREPMGLVKIFKFSFSLFFFKNGLNILVYYLQKRKQPFLDYKDHIIKKLKNWDFFKGFNPWFWSKFLNILLNCFSLKKKSLNILFDYLHERKQPFLDYKDDIIKKSKNWDFFKGVNPWFWSKF